MHAARIVHTERGAAQAWLYAGWLASRLGWTPRRRRERSFDCESPAGPVELRLEAAPDRTAGDSAHLLHVRMLAAESTALMLLSAGDHVIGGDDAYGGTYRLFTKVFARLGVAFDFVDTRDPEEVAEAIRPETRLVWLETPTNPLLKLADIPKITELARPRGVLGLTARRAEERRGLQVAR